MRACGFVQPASAAMMVRTSIVAEALPVCLEVARRRSPMRTWMSARLVTQPRSNKMATMCISRCTAISEGSADSSGGVMVMAFGLDGRCRVTRMGST